MTKYSQYATSEANLLDRANDMLGQILEELKYLNARNRAEDERNRNRWAQWPPVETGDAYIPETKHGTLTVPSGRVMTHNA